MIGGMKVLTNMIPLLERVEKLKEVDYIVSKKDVKLLSSLLHPPTMAAPSPPQYGQVDH